MLSETIKLRLTERFLSPLPEFHKHRIVFWHDEEGEFVDAVDELDLPGVNLVMYMNNRSVTAYSLRTSPPL